MDVTPRTAVMVAFQFYTGKPTLFFLLKCSLEPKLERASTMEERSSSGLDMFDVFFHKGNRLRVIGVGHQEIALHLHDLLVAI